MNIINSSSQVIFPFTTKEWLDQLKRIEYAGRICYKSEDKITDNSYHPFISKIIKAGHLSVIEHGVMTVHFVFDRGVSHEFVRHRIISPSQESTRYCDYSGKGITFIRPSFFTKEDKQEEMAIWKDAMLHCEEIYKKLRSLGCKPEQARSVLPNSLKTEIVVTANLREWRYIFQIRGVNKHAHIQMREVIIPLLYDVKTIASPIFDDIHVCPKCYSDNIKLSTNSTIFHRCNECGCEGVL